MLTLETPIQDLNRVGASTAKKLQKIDLTTVRDLLFYFPYRYDDFSRIIPIKDLKSGASANVVGQIELIQNRKSHRRRMNITEAIINDGTENMKVIWFNQPYLTKTLHPNDKV